MLWGRSDCFGGRSIARGGDPVRTDTLEALVLEADGDDEGALAAVLPVYGLAVDLGVDEHAVALAGPDPDGVGLVRGRQ